MPSSFSSTPATPYHLPPSCTTPCTYRLSAMTRRLRTSRRCALPSGFTATVTDHALITWLSCTEYVAEHALFTWLITHLSRDITCTDHVVRHGMITKLPYTGHVTVDAQIT